MTSIEGFSLLLALLVKFSDFGFYKGDINLLSGSAIKSLIPSIRARQVKLVREEAVTLAARDADVHTLMTLFERQRLCNHRSSLTMCTEVPAAQAALSSTSSSGRDASVGPTFGCLYLLANHKSSASHRHAAVAGTSR